MQRFRLALRFGYVPAFAIGFGSAVLHGVEAGWGSTRLVALMLAAVAVSGIAERIAPYAAAWNHARGDRLRDLIHLVVNESLAIASIASLPLLTRALGTAESNLWPREWPFAGQVLAALLLFDLGITFAHFASHRIPLLWRFHAVHHSVERMYGLNGILKHPVHQTIEMIAGSAPLVALGLPLDVAMALALLTTLQLLLQHSNVDTDTGPLGRWFAGAELHRLHHRREALRGDVNFGLFTTIGDRLLGTLDADQSERLGSADLGIEDEPDYPVGYLDQLVHPFRGA